METDIGGAAGIEGRVAAGRKLAHYPSSRTLAEHEHYVEPMNARMQQYTGKVGGNGANVAEPTVFNEPKRGLVVGVPAPGVVDHEFDIALVARGDHGVGFGKARGHGFLAEDRFHACFSRCQRHRRVQRSVRADAYNVEVFTVQHFLIRSVGCNLAKDRLPLCGIRCGLLGIDVSDRANARLWHGGVSMGVGVGQQQASRVTSHFFLNAAGYTPQTDDAYPIRGCHGPHVLLLKHCSLALRPAMSCILHTLRPALHISSLCGP